MKKRYNSAKSMVLLWVTCFLFSNCATIFGGKITDYQKIKPAKDLPRRSLRPVPLIIEVASGAWLALVIDFATGAIYKPLPKPHKKN